MFDNKKNDQVIIETEHYLDGSITVFRVCEQQRRRPACESSQSDQRTCYLLIGKYHI